MVVLRICYVIISIICIFTIIWIETTIARTYPIPVIAKPACRFQHRDTLSEDCKMQLPKIDNADYYAFKDNMLYRSIYTVLWWATYTYRRDLWWWWHPGVDIATAKGTPVVAIGDGIVVDARWRWDWWNTVIIKHSLNGYNIYSIYTHLDSIETVLGTAVVEWSLIGRVWDTGNAFGNHLHFQIDRDTRIRHPFFFPWCKWSIVAIVNMWLCKEQLPLYTIDPIVFLESQWATVDSSVLFLSPFDLISQTVVQQNITQEFIDRYPINIQTDLVDNTMSVTDIGKLNIIINGYDWLLPETLRISIDTGSQDIVDLSTVEISYINKARSILINPRKPWVVGIKISIWDVYIQTVYIAITPTSTIPKPDYMTIRQIPVRYGQLSIIRLYDDSWILVNKRHSSLDVSVSALSSLCVIPINSISQLRRTLHRSCTDYRDTSIRISHIQTISGTILLHTKKNIWPEDILIRRSDGSVIWY